MKITWKGSPNFSAGRGRNKVEFIVMHWIVGTLTSANNTFKNRNNQVSAHYGIGQNRIYQFVKDEDTAWHAGNFQVNQKSIGIEHEGSPTLPITDKVYENSAWLVAELRRRYGNLPLRRHSEFVATQCPGSLDLARIDAMANEINNPKLSIKNDNSDTLRALDECRATNAQLNAKIAELEQQAKCEAYKHQITNHEQTIAWQSEHILRISQEIDEIWHKTGETSDTKDQVVLLKDISDYLVGIEQENEYLRSLYGNSVSDFERAIIQSIRKVIKLFRKE